MKTFEDEYVEHVYSDEEEIRLRTEFKQVVTIYQDLISSFKKTKMSEKSIHLLGSLFETYSEDVGVMEKSHNYEIAFNICFELNSQNEELN